MPPKAPKSSRKSISFRAKRTAERARRCVICMQNINHEHLHEQNSPDRYHHSCESRADVMMSCGRRPRRAITSLQLHMDHPTSSPKPRLTCCAQFHMQQCALLTAKLRVYPARPRERTARIVAALEGTRWVCPRQKSSVKSSTKHSMCGVTFRSRRSLNCAGTNR